MKYRIKVEMLDESTQDKYKGETIYEQTVAGVIDLKAIINAFNDFNYPSEPQK